MKRFNSVSAVMVLLLLAAFPLVMLFAQSNQTKQPIPSLAMPPGAFAQDKQPMPVPHGTFAQMQPATNVPVQQQYYVPAGTNHSFNNYPYPTPPSQIQPEMLLEVYSLKKIKESPEKLLADGEIEELIQLYIFNSDAQDAFAINDTEQEFFAKYQKLGVKALASCKEKGNLLIVMAQAKQQEQIAAFLKKLEVICAEGDQPATSQSQQLYEPHPLSPQRIEMSSFAPVPVEINEPQIMFELIIAEVSSENADTPLTASLLEKSDFMNVVKDVIHSPTKDSMKVLFDALEKEKNVVIRSRPQMMASNNQLAVIFVGNEEKGLYLEIDPKILDEHRIHTNISVSSQIQSDGKANAKTKVAVTLQDGVPTTLSGILMKSDDSESVKEVVLCVRAAIVPPLQGGKDFSARP